MDGGITDNGGKVDDAAILSMLNVAENKLRNNDRAWYQQILLIIGSLARPRKPKQP